jgi:hypothetical protein
MTRLSILIAAALLVANLAVAHAQSQSAGKAGSQSAESIGGSGFTGSVGSIGTKSSGLGQHKSTDYQPQSVYNNGTGRNPKDSNAEIHRGWACARGLRTNCD